MAKQRMKRIGEEIKHIISSMLIEGRIKDTKVIETRGLISVTDVEVVNDLKYAYVYISVLGGNETSVLEGLQRASGFVRKEVGKELSLRYTPEIVFKSDHSIESGAHMNRILHDLGLHDEKPSQGETEEKEDE